MKKIIVILVITMFYLNLSAQEKFTDPRDGISYRTVSVAGAIWMAENLKYIIPESDAYYFDNDPNNVPSYGVLYEWKTAVKACP
ncbi:MAG: hypothetical protein NTW82_02870, partial [Bacteroidia bacterium]|nr:hypothetical protein [Bacteroidia bacterium]